MRIRRSRSITITTLIAAAVVTLAVALAHHPRPARASSHTPATNGFVPAITNPYLPYTPGSRWVYKGLKDGVTQTDTVTVTHKTRTIQGIKATTITDIATHGTRVLESTIDWYAQDTHGNVWYLGEATKAYTASGNVDTSGSWLAGRYGAHRGIVMTAHPKVDDAHRQEFWAGHAEDQYWLVDLNQQVKTPYVASAHAALTMEWSRLEPSVIDQKYYVPGIGVVKELAAKGPTEYARLIGYHHA